MRKGVWFLILGFCFLTTLLARGEEAILKLNLDCTSKTSPLPKIFSPSIDLSGRGYHRELSWPYHLAAREVLERWQNELSFRGFFRLYWNIWEIEQVKLDRPLRKELLANYETVIKNISDAGGTVILCLYGTPPGLGVALDKRSQPSNFKQWKALVKDTIRYLSCDKKYNIWYEVWSSPETEDFFLGAKKDYLNLYRMAAEAVRELKRETKTDIIIGGPAVSWWFQNFDGNTVISPEQSLIYELIRFCFKRKLPLDFISWHAYSTDPQVEKEITVYNKNVSRLVRDWLLYFRFDQDMPLIVDEWNFDSGSNLIEAREDKSYIAASYIPARLKNFYESGIDYQVFFSLEDFHNNKDGIDINRGIFSYDPESPTYTGYAKSIYNVFLMLNSLGDKLFASNLTDEFVGALATKNNEDIIILLWNYIDPLLARSYLSRNIAVLTDKGRKDFLDMFNSGRFDKIIQGEIPLNELKTSDKLRSLLNKAQELHKKAKSLIDRPRDININLSKIKGSYLYRRYSVSSSCAMGCPYIPVEEKEINIDNIYQETLNLSPYSVELVVFKKEISKDKK